MPKLVSLRYLSGHHWRLCGQLKFTEWNSKVGCTQLFWYYSFYSRHSFLIYVLLGNYQLVPAHSVSFRVLQIGQNHFSSHIFINFCLSPQSSVLITIIDCSVQAVFHSFSRIQHHTLSWRYYIFIARLEFALCWVNKVKKFWWPTKNIVLIVIIKHFFI